MKNSKKFRLLLITAMMTFATISLAQITKQQAIDFVMDSIVGNQFDSVNVYMETGVQTDSYYSITSYDSIQSPYAEYWLFFIDEQPEYLWGHQCQYIFIDSYNGDDWAQTKNLPPHRYNFILEEVSISKSITKLEFDFSVPYEPIATPENCNLYAVLFCGGDGGSGYMWSSLSHMYCGLIEQGFPEENIYVLSYDGTAGPETNPSLDLNNDEIDDIMPVECNTTQLGIVFNQLEVDMDDEDMLYVYVATHGSDGPFHVYNKSYFTLWDDLLSDSDFASMFNGINCSQMIFNIYSCWAGGFTDDLLAINSTAKKTILTCIDWKPYARSDGFCYNAMMDVYPYLSCSAIRGYHPDHYSVAPWSRLEQIGDHPSFTDLFPQSSGEINHDVQGGNNNGIQEINETILYVSDNDGQFALYGSKVYDCGFIEDLLSLKGITGKVQNSQTLDGNFLIGGDLLIEPGVELTLNSNSKFHVFESKIVIKPGAELIVDGGVITNACNQPWQGIEVWGDATQHQFEFTGNPLAQGKLILQNNAIIQNALNAVTTWKPEDWNTVGGIVIANNSLFKNNNRSVEFMPYQNYNPSTGDPMGYVSKFTECDFIVDNEYIMPDFNSHITMCDINGLKIAGCEFTNSNIALQNTGQGIFSINAGYRITDYCDAYIQPCPSENLTQTTFSNFHAGIIALNSGSSNTLYVNNAEFTNNGIGIQLNTIDNATIVNNKFHIGINTYAENCFTDGFGVGIDLINSNGYSIEENDFFTAQGTTSDAIGVNVYYDPEFAINHAVIYNEIYNNIFDGVHIANNTQGDNFNQDMQFGLVYLCNDNSNNGYDFYITDQGIQQTQGSLSEASGNEFSLNANNPYSDYNNQSDWSIMYFYEENNTAETPESYTEESFFPINVENANQCLSHYGDITKQDKGFGLTTSQLQYFVNIYNTSQVDYLGTKALYESLKDGGDTPGTITDVEGAWPDEMWEIRNELLEKSPHLTREVLVETADRTDLFPNAVIFEILSANPDAMKDKTLLEYLETKEDPLPQYMIDILAEAPGTISYKTILESDLAEYGGKKSRAANVIIRNILNDSLISTDSLVTWIDNLGTMVADYQIIDIYLQRGDTSTALALINALPTDYGFETDNVEYIRYKTLKQFQVQLLAESRNIYMLTAAEKTMLEDIVANSSARSGMQARNILQFGYENEYNDCPNMPNPNTHKSGNSSIYDLTSNMLEIAASPNPAKSWMAFNYSLPETSTNSSIEIHNVKGELVHVINLITYRGQIIWDSRNVQPGVYIFTLKSSGMIKSGKLIITQ